MEIRTVFCVTALFVQSITAQCYDRLTTSAYTSSQASSTSNQPASASDQPVAAFTKTFTTERSPLTITYVCPIAPSGVSLLSELGMEGQLVVTGSMPFLGAVQLDGTLPTSGTGTVNYGCGDTVVMTQEEGNPCGSNAKVESGLTLANLTHVR